MTIIKESLRDLAGSQAQGWVEFMCASIRASADGTRTIVTKPVRVQLVNGELVSPNLDPGPAVVTVAAGGTRREYPIVIPNSSTPVRLHDLLDQFTELPPPLVSQAWQAAQAAIAARGEVTNLVDHITETLLPQIGQQASDVEELWVQIGTVRQAVADDADAAHTSREEADGFAEAADASQSAAEAAALLAGQHADRAEFPGLKVGMGPASPPVVDGMGVAIGGSASAGYNGFAAGTGSEAGASGTSVGPYTSTGSNATAIGHTAAAAGAGATAIGLGSQASDIGAVAIGAMVKALHPGAVAIGARVDGNGAVVSSAETFAPNQIVLGTFDHTVFVLGAFALPIGAEEGKVWTSDADGYGSWQDAPGGGGGSNPALAFGPVDGAVPATASDNGTAVGHSSSADAGGTAVGALAAATSSGVAIGAEAEALIAHSVAVGNGAKARTSVAVALGPSADVSGAYSSAIGYGAKATGMAGVALGPIAEAGDFSIALGYAVKATHKGSIAMGVSSTETPAIAETTADNQIMLGTVHHTLEVPGAVKIPNGAAAGRVFTSDPDGVGSWQDAPAGGGIAGAVINGFDGAEPGAAIATQGGALAIGNDANAEGLMATAVGDRASAANEYAVSVGSLSTASGKQAVAVGYFAEATGDYSVALGNSVATHDFSVAVGLGAETTAEKQVMLGRGDYHVVVPGQFKIPTGAGTGKVLTSAADGTASWEASVAGGAPGVVVSGATTGSVAANAQAPEGFSVAIGHEAKAIRNNAIAIGAAASAQRGGIAIGYDAKCINANYAIAIGYNAKAPDLQSVAIGFGASTTAANQVMLGAANHTVVSPNKHQIGPDGPLAAVLSTRTNGSGKTELVAQFATGSPVVIATQP